MPSPTPKSQLDSYSKTGQLVKPLSEGALICTACGHRCKLRPGQRGICKVRFNEDGNLMVPFNYVAGVHNDPIEKKPFFHVMPGSKAFSFGMLGCDFTCAYCQNWFTSQSIRDDEASQKASVVTPAQLCDMAEQGGSKTLVSTYNEPLITSEWAVEIFKEAKSRGLFTAYVSNGHGTPEVLTYIKPWVDFYKVDLKSFDEKKYRRLGGNLPEVLESVRQIHAMGFWLEIVTLLIPGYNDSEEEIKSIAEFIASISIDIPWHITGFHPDYKMKDRQATSPGRLLFARQLGIDSGLKFVYSGNRAGRVEGSENTYCLSCGDLLIERYGFKVLANRLKNGACQSCNSKIPGVW
jgi:pyruvate formate lyase activating enzyme